MLHDLDHRPRSEPKLFKTLDLLGQAEDLLDASRLPGSNQMEGKEIGHVAEESPEVRLILSISDLKPFTARWQESQRGGTRTAHRSSDYLGCVALRRFSVRCPCPW